MGPEELVVATREDMVDEARRIIDIARERGIVLRLVGGLAVRFHCKSLDFCEREYGDIDLVGHRQDANRIAALFSDLGLPENMHVRTATGGRQLQFARERRHPGRSAIYGRGEDDHVDVFLDTFKMEHALDLTDRLEAHGYTVTASDLLLTKLQMTRLEDKDERDIFTLLHDLELGSADDPRAIDPVYISRLCAHDWGLFHDVEANLIFLRDRLGTYDSLSPAHRDRLLSRLSLIQQALEAEKKSRAWRLRARIGTHRPWHETVEEQETP